MNIGLIIKELSIKKKISIPELSKKLGKTEQAVYAMLNKQDLNTSVLREIATIFNVPIITFFEEEGSISQSNNGNSNILVGHDNNGHIAIDECKGKLEDAQREIEHLKERLKDKEEMIEILKSQLNK